MIQDLTITGHDADVVLELRDRILGGNIALGAAHEALDELEASLVRSSDVAAELLLVATFGLRAQVEQLEEGPAKCRRCVEQLAAGAWREHEHVWPESSTGIKLGRRPAIERYGTPEHEAYLWELEQRGEL